MFAKGVGEVRAKLLPVLVRFSDQKPLDFKELSYAIASASLVKFVTTTAVKTN
jgi:hypothetical protein